VSNEFLYLRRQDVEDLLDLPSIIRTVEESYAAFARGESHVSAPRGITLRLPGKTLPFMLMKPGATRHVLGSRIIVYPPEAEKTGTRFIILTDANSGHPLALINEAPVFNLRVGAQVAVAVRYLANLPVQRVGIVGTGKIAEGVARALFSVFPLGAVCVTSRTLGSRRAFSEQFSGRLGLRVEPVDTVQECCRRAEVVITATNVNVPLIRPEDVRPGMLLMPIGAGQELSPEIILKADKVLVDDWDYCTSMGDLGPLVAEGRFGKDRLYGHIGELVIGLKKGRENPIETIVAIPQGLASADIAVAEWLMKEARLRRVGMTLPV